MSEAKKNCSGRKGGEDYSTTLNLLSTRLSSADKGV